MTLLGVDVSSFQSVTTEKNWLPKIGFVLVKSTESTNYANPLHDAQVAAARATGDLVGHYHYAHPGANTAAAEAAFFLAHTTLRPGDVVALDYENLNSRAANPAAWVCGFINAIVKATGVKPWLYLSDYWMGNVLASATAAQADLIRSCPLWKAGNHDAYVSSPSASPGSLHGWATLTAWQWSSSPLDQNVFYGDAATWHALAIPGAHAPTTPTTQPTEADMPLTIDDARTIWRSDIIPSPTRDPANPSWQPDSYLRQIYLQVQQANVQVAALSAAVEALSKSTGADPAAIAALVSDAVKARLAAITVDVTDTGATS